MEHIALYRQFRPQTFDEIVEQSAAVTTIKQAVISGRIGHAYLFCGTRGTGKTTIAKVFSRAINCEHPVNGNPCNCCPTCKGILDGSILDVIEVDAASNNGVEAIRKICDEVNFAPSKAKYKVYIIDEVHMLSQGAFNALLKTLEEPPAHAVFLLATTEPHRILPTILSRCQRFDFKRISHEGIVERLRLICSKENIQADDGALSEIAKLSDGAMRDAISLLDQAQAASLGKTITAEAIKDITGTIDTAFLLKMASALIKGDYENLLLLIRDLMKTGKELVRFSIDLTGFFRDLLVVRMMPDPRNLVSETGSELADMYALASGVSAETLVGYIQALSSVTSDLKWSPSIATHFETSMIKLCGRKAKMPPVPLVIPDFVPKKTETAAAATEPVKAEVPAPVSEPIPVSEPAVPETAPVDKPAEPQAEAQAEEKPEEPAPAPEPPTEPIPAPVEEASAPAPEPVYEPTPTPMPTPAPAPASKSSITGKVFGGLSDSFLDDITPSKPKPTTRLASVLQDEELIVAHPNEPIRKPVIANETPDAVWSSIVDRLEDENFTLMLQLRELEYRVEDKDFILIYPYTGKEAMAHVRQLTSDEDYKKISKEIKSRLPNIGRVLLCNTDQYNKLKQVKSETEPVSSGLKGFIDQASKLNIEVDAQNIHFGDD